MQKLWGSQLGHLWRKAHTLIKQGKAEETHLLSRPRDNLGTILAGWMTQWLIPHSVWPRIGYPFMNCAESSVRCSVLCAAFGTSFGDSFLHSATSLLCDVGSILTLFKQGFWGFTWKGDNAIYAMIILLVWDRRSSWWEIGALSRQKGLL